MKKRPKRRDYSRVNKNEHFNFAFYSHFFLSSVHLDQATPLRSLNMRSVVFLLFLFCSHWLQSRVIFCWCCMYIADQLKFVFVQNPAIFGYHQMNYLFFIQNCFAGVKLSNALFYCNSNWSVSVLNFCVLFCFGDHCFCVGKHCFDNEIKSSSWQFGR